MSPTMGNRETVDCELSFESFELVAGSAGFFGLACQRSESGGE